MNTPLNEKISCYLTGEAEKAVTELTAVGLDPDLALAVLEKIWPEEAIYNVPE